MAKQIKNQTQNDRQTVVLQENEDALTTQKEDYSFFSSLDLFQGAHSMSVTPLPGVDFRQMIFTDVDSVAAQIVMPLLKKSFGVCDILSRWVGQSAVRQFLNSEKVKGFENKLKKGLETYYSGRHLDTVTSLLMEMLTTSRAIVVTHHDSEVFDERLVSIYCLLRGWKKEDVSTYTFIKKRSYL